MELKYYLNVLLRRWPVIVILPFIVAIVGGFQLANRTETYTAIARLSVIRSPDAPIPDEFQFDEYYNYQASEFAIDDLVEVVRGNVFADGVANQLAESGESGPVRGLIGSSRQHRVITISVAHNDPQHAVRVAQAAIEELEENALQYLAHREDGSPVEVRPVEIPGGASGDGDRARMIYILSIVVAFGFGVLLALLVDYVDDRLFDRDLTARALNAEYLVTVARSRK